MNWMIEYADGTALAEFTGTPQGTVHNNFIVAAKAKPVSAVLFTDRENKVNAHRLQIPKGAEPFARRRWVHAVVDGIQQPKQLLAHILGWQKGKKEHFLFIYPDGTTHETDTLEPEGQNGDI